MLAVLAAYALLPAAYGGITDFSLTKSRVFLQTSSSAPSIKPGDAYVLVASVTLSGPVSSASGFVLRPGGGAPVPLIYSPANSTLVYSELFASEQAINAAFPFGSYTFSVTLENATSTAVINFPAATFPSAPRILNFDELQQADADNPISILWTSFSEGVSGDFILVEAGDYQTPTPTEPGALPHTATSITLPAGVLEPATSNDSLVYFARVVERDTQALPGAVGFATVGTWTEFAIQTLGNPGGFQITTSSLPTATLGQAYSVSLAANRPVLFWSADEDELPPGITLDFFSGTLQGTPTAAGSFSIEFLAFGTDFSSTTRRLNLTVSSGTERPSQPSITSAVWSNGVFTLVLASPLGDEVQIEASTDLILWQSIATAAPVNGIIEFFDTPSPETPARFYRARWR
jgi:hypothetical protein